VLENARRHCGGHPVSVRARAVRGLARAPTRVAASAGDDPTAREGGERPSGGRVIVRIVDRGPGIPPAQLERVFEPFYRAGTTGGGHRGSGLGLAIARGFTQASSGSLHVESLPGQGASFVFELPLHENETARRADDDAGDGQRAAQQPPAHAQTLAPRPSQRTPGA
jgi:two-component system, OmpR family, sensor histidine kinase KdpD